MAIQKKNAKARLDKYYYLAKEKGYRARAAFKLIQLNKKYSFLQNSKCLLDLCAAPGSWLQVAAETMPQKSLIVGVDLAPIKPIPRVISFQDDITSDRCRATIRGHFKSWKADTVVHDGAPNVGTAWVQDAFSQNELVLASLKLATEFLAPNGTFVTKVFRSKDSAKLEWIFKQLFAKVEQTKPPSSRNVSAETFYVCRGYKAPKYMDPRFLDPKYAFAEVEAAAVNNEAKVFNPEKKKRKRDGYEEGDWTQFHEVPASEFIQGQDPIEMLGKLNALHFRQETNGDIALAALDKLPETTQEVRDCCQDLKVLGRKEFKLLLRWRLKARERFGFKVKSTNHKGTVDSSEITNGEGLAGEEVAILEPMDDELKLQEDLLRMKESQSKTERKKRRKENEAKQKDITRMQMHMTTPSEIGIEAADGGESTFRLRDVDRESTIRRQIVRGRMVAQVAADPKKSDDVEQDEEELEDEDGDDLERQLDGLYESYQERLDNRNTRMAAKRARMKSRGDDEEFEGFDGEDQGAETDASSDADLMEEDDDDVRSIGDQDEMMTSLQPKTQEGALSGRAATFFQQDIFQGIPGLEEDDDDDDDDDDDVDDAKDDVDDVESVQGEIRERDSAVDVDSGSASPDLKTAAVDASDGFEVMEGDDSEIEEVTTSHPHDDEETWDEGHTKPSTKTESGRPNIDIITAEAMTLAHALATGKVTHAQLTDDNFNKYSHRDVDGLPEWFLDDEGKHSRPHRPITAEAAKAIKEKLRAVNARPIKKVREAKGRKVLRAARRLEKLKKKSDGIAEGGEHSEKEKAASIAGLMAKAKKAGQKKRKSVQVVKAGGQNKGGGRPKGVKGKYKMVDARLKKDVRGEKRAAKRMKKR